MGLQNSKLFTTLNIGGVKLNNRVCMSPVSLMCAGADGSLGEAAKNFYLRRAEGGVGLILLGGQVRIWSWCIRH